jgi:hypothetical protein
MPWLGWAGLRWTKGSAWRVRGSRAGWDFESCELRVWKSQAFIAQVGNWVGCTGDDSTKIYTIATWCNRRDGRLGVESDFNLRCHRCPQ